MTNVQDILDKIEEFAPLALKEEGDPTGFQIGNRLKNTKKVLVTLDIRPKVVQEAIDNNIDLIVSHHPIMFHPAFNLDINNPQNRMYYDLIQHDIAVHSAHTNVDKTKNGMNDWLSESLNLQNVSEINDLDGLGRIGELSAPLSLDDFSELVKDSFKISGLRIVSSELKKMVKKVAIIGGDGGKFYPFAIAAGADTFVTGDVYYHTAHDMQVAGLNVIDPGHHIEALFIEKMAGIIQQWNLDNNWNLEVIKSIVNTEPYIFK